jgi:hypothetical protein
MNDYKKLEKCGRGNYISQLVSFSLSQIFSKLVQSYYKKYIYIYDIKKIHDMKKNISRPI